MQTLRNFLKEQAEELRAHGADREAMRDEWIAAVDRLLDQMERWLKEADAENILTFQRPTHQIREESIGAYEVRGMTISLGAREVRVVPVARSVAGRIATLDGQDVRPSGRVDVTNGYMKYMLLRTCAGDDESWLIVEDRTDRSRPLNQSSFEDIILELVE